MGCLTEKIGAGQLPYCPSGVHQVPSPQAINRVGEAGEAVIT